MARLLKRKRVPILSGDNVYDPNNYVDIPVIAEMSVIGSRGQEFRYRFSNDSRNTLRTVRVKKVGSAIGEFGEAILSLDNYVNAERILTSAYPNSVEMSDEKGQPTLFNQAWRTDKKFKNSDPPPKQPDGSDDPHHLQVHYVRYYKNNNLAESLWIDVEIIDMMELKATNGQDYTYKLRHPTPEDYAAMAGDNRFGQSKTDDDDPYQPIIGFCDPSLELLDIELGENGKPLDARLDPFQNIVNIFGSPWTFAAFQYDAIDTATLNPGTGPQHLQGDKEFSFSYIVGLSSTRAPSASSLVGPEGGYDYAGAPFNSLDTTLEFAKVCGFSGASVLLSFIKLLAIKCEAAGPPYLKYPNSQNPEPGWIATKTVDVSVMGWTGTGPFNVFSDAAHPEFFTPGMLSDATDTQLHSDDRAHELSNSIYVYGAKIQTKTQDFSAFTVTKHGTNTTYEVVAVKLPKAFLRDNTTEIPGAGGFVSILLKRVATPP